MAPWELRERPTYWRDLALFGEGAEGLAERMGATEARRQERIDAFARRGKAEP